MKKKIEPLRLKRETVVNLQQSNLPAVVGGYVQTWAPSFCNYCVH